MSAKVDRYHVPAQERVLKIAVLLAGHEAMGLSPTQIAKSLGISPSLVTRDMWNLEHAGFAEQLDGGAWRLGPKFVQIALAFQRGMTNLRSRVDEIEQRYTRSPQ